MCSHFGKGRSREIAHVQQVTSRLVEVEDLIWLETILHLVTCASEGISRAGAAATTEPSHMRGSQCCLPAYHTFRLQDGIEVLEHERRGL